MSDLVISNLRNLGVPYLEQYFGEWAMAESPFLQSFELVRSMDVRVHLEHVKAAGMVGGARARAYDAEVTPAGIAVIDLSGSMMKQVSSLSSGTSTVMLRQTIRQAAGDDAIAGIMLRIDSPGGTVAGTQDLADEIAAAAAAKPTAAYIDDMCASAAYWVASQADDISCGASAMVGSIGTYGVVHDMSEMAARDGVKVHVIRAGQHKGSGTPGTEITPEQLAEMQRVVDSVNAVFVGAVAKGRQLPLPKAQELNDGRMHIGSQAKAMGLVDNVESFDAAMSRLQGRVDAKRHRKNNAGGRSADGTGTAQSKEKPMTMAELKKACPNASADFLVAQLEAGATVAEARTAYVEQLQRQLEANDQELEAQKRRTHARPGVQALNKGSKDKGGESAGDTIEAFNAAVLEAMNVRGVDRRKAVAAVAKRDPQLHQSYLLATNPGRQAQALIAGKFEVEE